MTINAIGERLRPHLGVDGPGTGHVKQMKPTERVGSGQIAAGCSYDAQGQLHVRLSGAEPHFAHPHIFQHPLLAFRAEGKRIRTTSRQCRKFGLPAPFSVCTGAGLVAFSVFGLEDGRDGCTRLGGSLQKDGTVAL